MSTEPVPQFGGAPTFPVGPPMPPPRRSNRRILLITGLVIVLAAGLAVGGWWRFGRSGAIHIVVAGRKVDNARQVLHSTERQVGQFVDAQRGARNSSTRCYFDRPAHAHSVTHTVFCGPVLFYDGNPARTFLPYRLTTKPAEHGRVKALVASTPVSSTPIAAPPADTMIRPDGKSAPMGTGGLSVPVPPAASPNLIQPLSAPDTTLPAAPANAVMAGDRTTVTVSRLGPVRHIGRAAETRSAPPGQKLIEFAVRFGPGENGNTAPQKVNLGLSVDGGRTRKIPFTTSKTAAGVAVPVAARSADLVLIDGGVTQRLSLLTGAPDRQNIVVLRRQVRDAPAIDAETTAMARVSFDGNTGDALLDVQIDSARLEYFADHYHARPSAPNHAFLYVDMCFTSPDFVDPVTCHGFRHTDLSLALPDGRTVAARDLSHSDVSHDVFEVPADFTTGTVIISHSEAASDGWRMTITQPGRIHVSIPRS